MNFFEHQERARKRTSLLVVFFVLAVLALVSVTSLVLLVFFNGGEIPWLTRNPQPGDWKVVTNVSMTVLLVVLFASLFKHLQLKGGGKVVAESLGGRLLAPNTQNSEERRLLNLVEEMALASGTPVPPVYLLEEPAINAFAAGYSPQDAVIGITRGALQELDRDELQGVIAHEFSHIFNGDMRLNLRLITILHGILVIGLGGRLLMHSVTAARFRGSSRDGRVTMGILTLGLVLLVIGSIGIFFGKLIKAAVSRQREFLADASAVQFTRNPLGIASALNKIRQLPQHSTLQTGQSEQFSHLFFSNAISSSLSSLLATHPPLEERIQRLNAGPLPEASPHPEDPTKPASGPAERLDSSLSFAVAAQASIAAMGQPNQQHLEEARRTLNQLSPELLEATHEPWTARALIYGLLLSPKESIRQHQLAALNQQAAPETLYALKELQNALKSVKPEDSLALAELSLPALKYLTPEQKQRFYHCIALLIRADQRLSLFEWSLSRLVQHSLDPEKTSTTRKLQQLGEPIQELLSLVVWLSTSDQPTAQQSFTLALTELGQPKLSLLPREQLKISRLDDVLKALNALRPLEKPRLLKAIAVAVSADGQINRHQTEVFRVLGVCLDCPLPPLVNTH